MPPKEYLFFAQTEATVLTNLAEITPDIPTLPAAAANWDLLRMHMQHSAAAAAARYFFACSGEGATMNTLRVELANKIVYSTKQELTDT